MICIYISDEKIKLIDGAVRGGKIVVNSFCDISTTAGSLETGNIKDLMVFTQVLQDCMQSNNIKPSTTTYVLDNSRIAFREMIVPDVPDSKIKKVIASEIFSDAKVANNTLDYVVVERFKTEDKKFKLKILVTYISNDNIDSLHTSGMELGLSPSVLDVAPNAIAKIIEKYKKTDKKLLEDTFLLLDFKDTFVSLHVFDDYKSQFSKSSVLYVNDTSNFDMEYLLQELASNINSIVRYYESRNENKEIKAVYVTGNAAVLDEILQDLADSVNMMVSHLPLPSFVKGLSLMDFNAFSCALGAFIRR